MTSPVDEEVRRALLASRDETMPVELRVARLMAAADGLRGKDAREAVLHEVGRICDRAVELAAESQDGHLVARARLGKSRVLSSMKGSEALALARVELERALPVLRRDGGAEEVAEAEMRLGIALQRLASSQPALLPGAIGAYRRALRTFERERYPQEFAILHNNLATAYLSLPPGEEGERWEALAVASFEEALTAVTLTDEPVQYAMLQNNLGNALQFLEDGQREADTLRAIAAYDEALKVRTVRNRPIEHAITVANKAYAMTRLPDAPSTGRRRNHSLAIALYRQARTLFAAHGLHERAALVSATLEELRGEGGSIGSRVRPEGRAGSEDTAVPYEDAPADRSSAPDA